VEHLVLLSVEFEYLLALVDGAVTYETPVEGFYKRLFQVVLHHHLVVEDDLLVDFGQTHPCHEDFQSLLGLVELLPHDGNLEQIVAHILVLVLQDVDDIDTLVFVHDLLVCPVHGLLLDVLSAQSTVWLQR
jgi:hypothetical protein